MGHDAKHDHAYRYERGVVLVSAFAGPVEATTARSTLRATLADLAAEVGELFRAQGGIVDGEQVSRIYARVGLRNDMGWQQQRPVTTKGAELIWELPEGAYVEDAENLLVSLGALSVVAHHPAYDDDAWRAAPAPFPLGGPLPDDEPEQADADEDESYPTQAIPKRNLH